MKEASGVITAITEGGFELDTGPGMEFFSLGMDAVLEAGELADLVRTGRKVTVEYHDIPDETSHVAMRIFPDMHPGFRRQTH
jgi:hypothetical protein